MRMLKIPVALRVGTAVAVSLCVALAGCCKREWAPRLSLPPRPVLSEITQDEWSRIPEDTREKLSENLELLYWHANKLERTISSYQDWRACTAN